MSKSPELVITDGVLAGRRIVVDRAELYLGRSSSNDVHIPDEELSRKHCRIELGKEGLRLSDLNSANGTRVNGAAVGDEPVGLKDGDVIEVGATVMRVADPKSGPSPSGVDLGLGAEPGSAKSPERPRSPLANILWAVAVLVAVGSIVVILMLPDPPPQPAAKALSEDAPVLREMSYEKVKADAKGIFRYALTLDADGALSVKIDDTSNDRRLPVRRTELSDEARHELGEILSWKSLGALDRDYVGVEPDPPALDGATLKVVYSTDAKSVRIVNTDEPPAFTAIREKLEAFSKSALGVWAISYSRERLIELAEESVRLGDAKWEERDVNYGNLSAAIVAYGEAIFYLQTVNPKPACAAAANEGLERAKKELERRYVDQRFRADKALNLSQWEAACEELKILLEMVPDRKDGRNRDARQKLVSAETNLKKGGK